MINMKHAKVVSKPPPSRCPSATDTGKPVIQDGRANKSQMSTNSNSFDLISLAEADPGSKEIDAMIKNIGSDIEKLQTKGDFNRRVIEPDSCSFDRLCSMINDLERNIAVHGIDGLTRFDDEKETTMNCESRDESEKYSVGHQLRPGQEYFEKPGGSSPSTYEDIMSLLGVLDREEYLTDVPDDRVDVCPKNVGRTLNGGCVRCRGNQGTNFLQTSIPDTLKEDLATLQLQLEERNETVKFLKNELKSQRRSACEKLDSQTKRHVAELQTQKTKYQTIVKRHQKFIEQIISDKKDLTEKCNALTEHVKEMEVKYRREFKVIADRHAVELQRARELCAASDKIRRERWLEAKTSKIKEMTVKGLEPELRSMVEQHRQEVQEIRSAHIKELQDTELRTIRRSNQQLEQLRLELTASHEKILSNEKENLSARYREKLERQESLFQEQRRKLIDDLERDKKMLAEEQKRLVAEKDAAISRASSEFQDKVNTLMRQNQIEKKSFQESLRVEQETWMENCRRQHNLKLEKMESRLRDECNRERDRQIELAIERLEKETLEMKTSLRQSSENRLRCTKEKYEAELQDASNSEQLLKSKVTSMQERLTEATNQLQKTEEKLQQCSIQLSNSNQIVDRLTIERNNAKTIVRQEIETEKRELEAKIATLYRELTDNNSTRDVKMAQLYSRVKLIVAQKDLIIGKLYKENEEVKQKCDHLDKLLDQQRRDYVLKSL